MIMTRLSFSFFYWNILLLSCLKHQSDAIAVMDDATFYYQSLAPIPVNAQYHDIRTSLGKTELNCALECSVESLCKGFLWQHADGMCAIFGIDSNNDNGTRFTTGEELLYIQEGVLESQITPSADYYYYSDYHVELSLNEICDASWGYKIMSNDNETRCLKVSSHHRNYFDAIVECDHLGRLYKANSIGAIDLVFMFMTENGLPTNLRLFVGLDDIEEENEFRWSDGMTMTPFERSVLFKPDFLDNYQNEDCVILLETSNMTTLSDVDCEALFKFVCEIVLE